MTVCPWETVLQSRLTPDQRKDGWPEGRPFFNNKGVSSSLCEPVVNQTMRHPLEQIMDRLESNICATPEGFGETLRALALYLDLPLRDYTATKALALAFVPPGWEVFLHEGPEGDWSCYLRKGKELTRGCGPRAGWAILFAALWAMRLEEASGCAFRPDVRGPAADVACSERPN
jgi:hypothetical protein